MALTGGLFDGVDDTPFLRARLRELEQDADVLRDRSSRLTRDCRAYRDALEDAYASEVNFQESVRSLYGSIDDAFGNAVGASVLERLLSAMSECAAARGDLMSEVETELIEPLAKIADGPVCQEVADARRRFDRTNADHERARAKFLALTKDAKEEHLRAAEAELASTRHEFETARSDPMGKLQRSALRDESSSAAAREERGVAPSVLRARARGVRGTRRVREGGGGCDATTTKNERRGMRQTSESAGRRGVQGRAEGRRSRRGSVGLWRPCRYRRTGAEGSRRSWRERATITAWPGRTGGAGRRSIRGKPDPPPRGL